VLHNECRLVRLVSDCLPAVACVLRVSYFRLLSHVYHPITYPSFEQLPSFEQSHVRVFVFKTKLGKLDAWPKSNVCYFFCKIRSFD
jgi:hypothetical protein